MIRRVFVALCALTLGFAWVLPSPAHYFCPFCSTLQGNTLVKEVQQAAFVVYGKASNPRLLKAANGTEYGLTDITIVEVIKSHKSIENKKTFVLNRYLQVDKEGGEPMVIFCDYYMDEISPFRGIASKDGLLAKYIKGALAIESKDAAQKLRYYFDFLDSPDAEIASDAYKEFASADYNDVVKLAKLPDNDKIREQVLKWMRDPNTQPYRFGLYGLILGLSGKAEDGKIFLDLLNDPERGLISGVDGVLAGYILTDPKNGWEYLSKLMGDASVKFPRRYAGLRATSFFIESHQGTIKKEEIVKAVAQLLDQDDIIDLGVEYLRKWKEWGYTKKIFDELKAHPNYPTIVERSVIRYALDAAAFGNSSEAKEFLTIQRAKDPNRVKDIEELLQMERTPLPTASTPSAAK